MLLSQCRATPFQNLYSHAFWLLTDCACVYFLLQGLYYIALLIFWSCCTFCLFKCRTLVSQSVKMVIIMIMTTMTLMLMIIIYIHKYDVNLYRPLTADIQLIAWTKDALQSWKESGVHYTVKHIYEYTFIHMFIT